MPLVKRLVKGSALTYAEADGNLTYLDNKVTGSTGLIPVFDSANTVTGSSVLELTGSLVTINGSLTVTGDLTAMQYIISSSVTHFTESFSSGSTRFGDSLDDTHQFTGSVSITGSLFVNDSSVITSDLTSSISVLSSSYAQTSSYSNNTTTSSYSITSSYASNAELLDGKNSTIFATTGSNIFNGTQKITGSFDISGSTFLNGFLSSSDGGYFTNDITVTHMTIGHGPTKNNTNTAIGWITMPSLGSGLQNTVVGAASCEFLQSGSGNTVLGSNTLAVLISGSNNTAIGQNAGFFASGSGNVFIGYQAGQLQTSGNNKLWIANNNTLTPLIKGDFATGLLQFYTTGSTQITGSLLVTGSSVFSGSATGVVNSLTISSNTASLDLNRGNFFTLQLVGGSDTYINPSNINPGQTVNILISTTGSGTVSFPNIVLQASGSEYIPTTTTGKDIITLVSYDSTNLYLANVKNLI